MTMRTLRDGIDYYDALPLRYYRGDTGQSLLGGCYWTSGQITDNGSGAFLSFLQRVDMKCVSGGATTGLLRLVSRKDDTSVVIESAHALTNVPTVGDTITLQFPHPLVTQTLFLIVELNSRDVGTWFVTVNGFCYSNRMLEDNFIAP